MAKKFGAVICVVAVVVLFFGLIKYYMTGEFGVTYLDVASKLNSAPTVNDWISYEDGIKDPFMSFASSLVEVTDFFSFFTAVGAFFSSIGKSVFYAFNLISMPVRYLAWFLRILFTF